MKKYANYHRHSKYSNIATIDCTLTVHDYVRRALELGHTSISTVEHGYHGGMTSILEAYEVCQKNGLKLLVGAEAYFVEDRFEKDKTNYHIVIMALNHKGLKQLNLALSEANMTGYYYKARLDFDIISKLDPKNFIVTTACVAGVGINENILIRLRHHFGENFFLEVQSHNHHKQIEHNELMLKMAKKYGIKLIHGCDTHFITEQDKENRSILLKGKGMNYGDEDLFQIDYPTYDEIVERYKIQGVLSDEQAKEAIENTLIIEEKTEQFVFEDDIKMPTLFPNDTHEQKVKKLKDIVNGEFKKQYGHSPKEDRKKYFDALRFEMDIIEGTQMEDYFLDNYYIIKRAKELGGILTQTGRGSGVSFLINKLLGFTNIDRLEEKIELYPTRFMSKSRILETRSLPDIDHNLVDQTPFVEATREYLGEHGCYVMISFGEQKEKARIKNVCRAMNISPTESNEITKDIEGARKQSKYEELFKKVDAIGDVIESASPNPCGFLLLSGDIREEIGIIKVGDAYCAMIDKNTADKWKYLKNDYLMVSVWLLISEVYKELGKPIDSIKDLKQMTMNDKKVWGLYEDGITATLNQTSTQSSKLQVMQYKPQNVEELSHFVAGIRPSFESMKSYLLNRQDFSYGIPEFDKLLETSMNFVLYQENIMSALVYAGIPEDETYGIIKAVSKKKKDVIMQTRSQFVEGFTAKTGSEENAEKVWKIIEDASAYGFNSSHSLSVAYDSLYGAYLKANYPVQYYSVALNINEGDEKITHDLISELPYFGIELSDIKFGYSQSKYSYDLENKVIYKGLKSIKFMNETVANELYKLANCEQHKTLEKNGERFVDLLVDIVETTSVNSRQMKILIQLGFFSDYGKGKYLMNIYDLFSKKYKKTLKLETKSKRIDIIKEEMLKLDDKEFTIKEIVEAQNEFLGYISYKNENIKPSVGVVTGIDGNYATKWINIYYLRTGKNMTYKISGNILQELEVTTNDIINVKETELRPKTFKTANGWEKDYNSMQEFITKISKIK